MVLLPRNVMKWLQSLDLSKQIKNPKRDCCNATIIAEIFSWYFPYEIKLDYFIDGQSTENKVKNWTLLNKFIEIKKIDIPNEYIDGTIYCKDGAAEFLLKHLHELLTGRNCAPVEKGILEQLDQEYHISLPMFARSTASQRIKEDIDLSEEKTRQCLQYNQKKAQHMIEKHLEIRRLDREMYPSRFQIRSSLASKCPRISLETREKQQQLPNDLDNGSSRSSTFFLNAQSSTNQNPPLPGSELFIGRESPAPPSAAAQNSANMHSAQAIKEIFVKQRAKLN